MAYADTYNTGRNLKTGVAVLALEAGLATALVLGLAYKFTPPKEPPPLVTHEFKELPPPKPKDDPKPTERPQTTTRTPPPPGPQAPDLGKGPEIVINEIPLGPAGGGLGEVKFPPPTPPTPPAPSIKAKPRGNPGLWVSENDYPTADLRAGHEGITRFRLKIGTDGRVKDCEVTGSSGFAALDAATCAKLTTRARFDPASDSTGARIEGSYANSVRWKITNP